MENLMMMVYFQVAVKSNLVNMTFDVESRVVKYIEMACKKVEKTGHAYRNS